MRHGQSVHSRRYEDTTLYSLFEARKAGKSESAFLFNRKFHRQYRKRGVPLSKPRGTGRSSQLSTERTLRNSALHRKASNQNTLSAYKLELAKKTPPRRAHVVLPVSKRNPHSQPVNIQNPALKPSAEYRMIGHVLAGIIAPERKGSRGLFLRKNCIQSRTASLGQCFRVEFPTDHHLHRFANRVVHVSK
jgi:hypothetical protein